MVVKEAVGKGAAPALVEKGKGEADSGSFGGQPIGVAFAVPFEQTPRFHFARVKAELIQSVAGSGKMKAAGIAPWICLAVQTAKRSGRGAAEAP